VLPAAYVTQDAQLALLYAMADAYVLPSLEENLPNVILESLACGTPLVAFDTWGHPRT
jgi:glycosyltransferase involved in cell wall biosynthesis